MQDFWKFSCNCVFSIIKKRQWLEDGDGVSKLTHLRILFQFHLKFNATFFVFPQLNLHETSTYAEVMAEMWHT